MSAIAGFCYWDGRPIPDSDLAVLSELSKTLGPDGSRIVAAAPGVVLQAHALHFDRLSSVERQPHAFGPGSVLTWDGRLDNRDDLLVAFHHDVTGEPTDVALVAAAYVRWGLDALPRLVGDWSLALWDAATRTIVLASDYMGNRPLHYLEVPGGLAWASNAHALAVCFHRDTEPDEAFIAGRLTHNVAPDVTPFRGVRRLQAGHFLIAAESSVAERRYWTFDPSTIRFGRTDDYTDRLRDLLTEAVRVRLRAKDRVWSHLSGGFDSSSIVCIADALIRRGQVEASEQRTLSLIFSDSPESDESRYIDVVERWCGLKSVRTEWTEDYPVFSELLGHTQPYPYPLHQTREAPAYLAGDRIVLSGQLGDLVMLKGSSQSISLFEPLHEGRPLHFLRESLVYAKRRRRSLPLLLASMAWKTYAPTVRSRLLRRRKLRDRLNKEAATWGQKFVMTAGVTSTLLQHAVASEGVMPPVTMFRLLKRPLVTSLYAIAARGVLASWDQALGVWMTYPFAHRPLVEFVIGVPQAALWNPRLSRAGMKRALTGILPPELLARTSKGDPTAATLRAKDAWDTVKAHKLLPPEPADEWELVRRGYVDADVLAHAARTVLGGTAPNGFVIDCVYLEGWLRSLASMRRARNEDEERLSQSFLVRNTSNTTVSGTLRPLRS